MLAPDKLLCFEWVKKAWAAVTREVMINSFVTCDISVKRDGSEDGFLHPLREAHGVAVGAPQDVSSAHNRLI